MRNRWVTLAAVCLMMGGLSGGARRSLAAVTNSFVLNEANTAASDKFLDQERPAGPRNRGDATLGRVQGNGQNWLEFLVVQGDELGGGAFANTLDLRGWKIAWSYHKPPTLAADPDPNHFGSGVMEFTNDPLWAAVPKGTLLTISEWKEAWYHDGGIDHDAGNTYNYHGGQRDGGIDGFGVQKGMPEATFMADPTFKKLNFATDTKWNPFATGSDGVSANQTGDWRIHAWAGERTPDMSSFKYFNFSGTIFNGEPGNPGDPIAVGTPDGGLYAVNNDSWDFKILEPVQNAPDNVIQGPIGEALSAGSVSVGSDEIYRLENFAFRTPPATQNDYLGAAVSDYVDGTTSTYGRPNEWSGSSSIQDLTSLRSWVRQGDMNLDGRVDGGDLMAWQRGFGLTNASLTDGDVDGNGTVNAADLALWKSKYAQQATAVGTAVPECSSQALALTALAASLGSVGIRRRRQR